MSLMQKQTGIKKESLMRIVAMLFFVSLISGCTTYNQNTLLEPSVKLERNKSVAIFTPPDGFYETTKYPKSGEMTALAIKSAFAKYTDAITVMAYSADINALKNDKSLNFGYYVIPSILHWEDRVTEWTGMPDRTEVKISIYDGQSWKEIASTIISGKSKWATLGGDHPQDLLAEPINKYVESLY